MTTTDLRHLSQSRSPTAATHFLTNVVREPLQTCCVCGAPVRQFRCCWRCAAHQPIPGIADIVAPLVYAVAGTESAALVSKYKNHPIRIERERCAIIIADLLQTAIQLHENCFGAVAGVPVTARTVVPSLTWRCGVHPLASIAESIGVLAGPALIPGCDARCDRRVRANKFAVKSPSEVADRHVLVLDDVWTTGSNAQSAALALHRAGAAAVSVLVIGRWLSPGSPLTYPFLGARPGTPYDPHVCPVTGGCCPPESASRSP
jgi:predicted amidophosphoribosyltransferase